MPGSRARETTHEGWVQLCAELMRRREWKRGETGKALAVEAGVAESTMRTIAAEAWHRVAADESPGEVRVLASDTLRLAIQDGLAEDGKNRIAGRRTAVEAVKVLVALVGAAEPEGLPASNVRSMLAALPKAERRARLAEIRSRMNELEDELAEEAAE